MAVEQTEPSMSVARLWQRPFRAMAARPRLIGSVLLGLLVYGLLPGHLLHTTRVLIAWDSAVFVFLALGLSMMVGVDQATLRRHAEEQDEGRNAILILAVGAAIASVSVIVTELAGLKGAGSKLELARVAFTIATIVLSWFFVQFIFALHYASIYHSPFSDDSDDSKCGLAFPGGEPPDYWDFLHFAIVIGVACQTADIAIKSKEMRRVSTAHSLIAFAFNTTILALMINLAASLF
jgi:uncharacterized membrane protein